MRELRRQRKDFLNSLTTANGEEFLSIPDGPASTGQETIKNGNRKFDDSVSKALSCYSCKSRFYKLHFFYSHFCGTCSELNYRKRLQSVDLKGKVVLITGARVKIGYQTLLKVLRMGARVIATTRFPKDCVRRLKNEEDFPALCRLITVYRLDLKDLRTVEQFCNHVLSNYSRLDAIINNACQTIRRPKEFYQNLRDDEGKPLMLPDSMDNSALITDLESPDAQTNDAVTSVSENSLFPVGLVDKNGQQIDLRTKNSWVLKLSEVETTEVVEVLAVNSVSPFILNSKLKPLLLLANKHNEENNLDHGTYIINVSAMEGKFYRHKNANHPHTNMAKAALNMMTRTSAQDYAKDGIYMNSVDTGWINDENPLPTAVRIHKEHNFQTPIDEIDAAARLLDPIITGIVNPKNRVFGKFLKDFKETEW